MHVQCQNTLHRSRSSRLLVAADRIKFHVVALQEAKIKKTDIFQLNNGTVVIRGEKVQSRSVGGVGLVVHLVDLYVILSSRIAVLRLQLWRHKKITIINCYSLTDAADEYELNAFHYQLEEAIHNKSEYRIGNFGLGERSENGNRLAGLLSAACPFHGNSFFQKKESRRWTWESLNGMTHAEIDHILTNRRWCLLDTSVVPSFCTGSEHRLLREDSIQAGKELFIDHEEKAVYNEDILNEFLSKRDWQIKEDQTEDYEMLDEGLKSCAEFASVPQARRSDRISITTKELLEKRRKLKLRPTATRLT
ncbi:unnamed protein product [Angiostrongylus costaricensis]|uniref:Endo/exonuclease/phosphatase domain-containing protein n=1 Tax=Angiostrongylus costaricensis TaxID=334426 RepID=A0A0R3PCQ3_ANGCS|nr:unnamed protein product [Angiostrongylus costaricensis]